MIFKTLTESKELKTMRSLNARMRLSEKDLYYYMSLEKGYEGELLFRQHLRKLTNETLILHELLLEYNKTLFQIDVVVISPETIYVIDVKNFEDDYYIESETWYKVPRFETKNPLLQLKRAEPLFRRLVQEHGFNFPIEASLVFVNPKFFLYQAPLNSPMIFPSQLNKFLNKLNSHRGKLKSKHIRLAEKLVSLHTDKPPYTLLPKYEYDGLEKGVVCGGCGFIVSEFTDKSIICKKCGFIENVNSAILRSVEEFKMLFPERKITTNQIYDWCNKFKAIYAFRKILSNNLKQIGHGKSLYYE